MHRIIKPGKFARIFAKSQRIHHCRLCSSVQNAVKKYKDGDKIHGYTVKKVVEVPELMLTSVVLHHDKTGAEHLHVARDDSNNAFSVMFRTTPMDSTGVPHILEHTTLCGSRRFPVRDPFFKMLNRSLSTFMNAMTASDWTMYPFSSQNQKDFENLLSVYLDAVFFPQLRELDFSQEGWRLENENPEDKSSPLMFKGVVYNEMKGVFSNKDNIYCQAVENELLPSHTYGVVSGGEPSKITDLTWEHLKNFHASHYHPSNSRFYTYGNFPLEKHLEYINSNYLQKFDKIDIDTKVPNEPRWTEMRRKHITCQPDPMAPDQEKQTTMSVSYLLTDISETFESFTLSIIGALLMDGETSPFYQSLLVPNIGSDFAPMTGYHSDTKDSAFSVGLQGISSNDVEKVTQIISDTFDQVVSEGFEQKRIDALLHQIELGQKHQSSNFGVKLTLAISHSWNHDTDPVESLQINKYVEQFRQKLQDDPQFLQNKVKQYFKNNKHCLVSTMSPDEKFEEKRKEEETTRLQKMVEKLTDEDKEQIYKKGQTLLQQQMDKEDLSCLPTLHINEIDRKIIEEKTATVTSGKVPVQLCVQPTNGITYLHMMSNMRDVPSDLKPYVPLFCDVITKMGAGSMDYKELSQQIELTTSGLGAGTHVNQHHSDNYSYEQGVEFSSYCLDRNVDKMLDLWTNIFCSPNLKDEGRLMTLVMMEAANLSSSISGQGHSYAMTHSSSRMNAAAQLKEVLGGMAQVSTMKTLAETDESAVITIVEKLQKIGQFLLNKNNIRFAINSTSEQMSSNQNKVEKFIEGIPGDIKSTEKYTQHGYFEPELVKTQFELPFSVNYMSKAVETVPYTHEDFPILRVLSRMMSAKYLHREIREKGGAYGSGAVCGSGVFSFYSYRDPNSSKTLQVFDEAVKWVVEDKFVPEDVDEAKLSVFQQTDKPITPGSAGMTLFLSGITDEMRQTMRDRLFQVSKQDVINVTKKYLTGDRPAAVSFIGPENSIVKTDDTWKVIKG